ncbi:MAG: tRNA uridine-5-carboxymethylaminomethyl(34) synthesis GTPase MnmE [Desulfitobacteriia bacterium]|jgi:tRNA modification GTPase
MDDTIVALATPSGQGAIHIIRLSGEKAFEIADSCFEPLNIEKWQSETNHTLHLGWFSDRGKRIDQVLIGKMAAPLSFTGEDTIEINCHGGMLTARRIIETCLHAGARLAEPGEFSKRAFLNGKMDLIQAEAVVDLITARTDLAADLALLQLEGHLSTEIDEIRQEILNILSFIEVTIDFPEDEIGELNRADLTKQLQSVKAKAEEVFEGSKKGKIIREGLSTVIAGQPNVGKSSLLNALLKEERAIVTDIPGTTRDEIHESVKIGDILLNLIDTAGLRESDDPIEMIGIQRTWKALERADLILLVLEAKKYKSQNLSKEEEEILKNYADKTIVLVNKIDLLSSSENLVDNLPAGVFSLPFSVKNKLGFKELEDEIFRRVMEGESFISSQPLLSNIRQIQALEKSLHHLEKSLEAIYAGVPLDLISIDVRLALEEISFITGHSIQEDLLNNIFSRFCIGK